MIFGYARVSTQEQNLDLQLRALLEYGVEEDNIYKDVVSGAASERKKLEKLLGQLRKGDTVVVWKLDRLARSLIHFTKIISDFNKKGIFFKSITEPMIDTTQQSAHSKFVINMFAILSELERDMIIERTKAGLESARLRGSIIGRPKGVSKKGKEKAKQVAYYFNEGTMTIEQICNTVKISRATYYKYLKYEGLDKKIRPYKKV